MCRAAVDARGMSSLVSRSGQEAVTRMTDELQGEDSKATFDPLMPLHNHFWGEALRCGGLYIMGQNETGENEGHYCPVCEFVKHSPGFSAEESIGSITDQMLSWAREQALIPKVQ